MPGIVGIICREGAESHASMLRIMVKAMEHEPFYSSGTYENTSLGVYVGWVCHSGSFADCVPVWNQRRDICLIFAGENFTDDEEIERIEAASHSCKASNASYLVNLYEELGPQFVERLNGWFSGVLIDLRQHAVLLFNDRYGLHRVYYHENATGFYFGSEAKSLLRVLPDLREMDLPALGEMFSCGCVLEDKTLFSGVALLPPAAKWTFNRGVNVRRDSYFDVETWEAQPVLKSSEFYARLKSTFARILPRYLRDHDAGMSLTGGLDGRMIMAWGNPAPGTLPCYTFGGEYRDCHDVKIARRIARLCGQEHQTLTIGDEFWAEFPALAEKAVYVSDGTMDVTGSVELYANRLARRVAPIRLTGNYGSEIIRGNVAFRPAPADRGLWSREFLPFLRAAETTYTAAQQGHEVSFIAFKQVPWYHFGRFVVEQSQLTPRSPYLDNELVSLMYQAPREVVRSREASLQLIEDGNPQLARIPTDRGRVRERVPAIGKCRHLWQEFTMKAEYAYDYGMPQWLAAIDQAVAPLRPERLFLGRHKFCHFRIGYRDRLPQYLKDILLDPRSLARPYLNRRYLETMVEQHISGKRNHTSELHQILTAELVQRQLIEQS